MKLNVITVNIHHQASFMHIRIRHERCLVVNKMGLEELEQFNSPHHMCAHRCHCRQYKKYCLLLFPMTALLPIQNVCVWWCPYTSRSCPYRLSIMLQAHNKGNIGLDVCDKPETWFTWVQSVFGHHHPSFLRKR
jgi:hypothetical protein